MLPLDSMSWTSTIRNLCLNAKHQEVLSLFVQKFQCSSGFQADSHTFAAVFKSCAALFAINVGRALQGYAVKQGELACQSVYKGLLNLYAKCGAFDECWKLFEQLDHRDVVTWNIILSGYCGSQIHDIKAMRLFVKMHAEGEVKPSAITIASILPVCARVGRGVVGKSIHSHIMKSGLERDTLVGNALISMYAKSEQPQYDAYAAFNSIIHKDVVSWNAIISALAEKNLMFDALQLFSLMLEEPIEPNYITIACILPVCASFSKYVSYRFGKEIHGFVQRRTKLMEDISVCNALMNLYLRVGQMEDAEILFSHLKQRDLVSWNTIISGYSLNDEWLEAVDHFCKLLCLGIEPDSITLISVLPSCAYSQNLQMGKMIHGYILRHLILSEDSAVGNALVSFYTKCYDVKSAFHSFSLISSKDLISWNSMLNAFADFGNYTQFLHLLDWMLQERFKPDHFTILSIISFCITVLGGWKVKEMHCYSIRACFFEGDSGSTILNALLDAYSKCGNIDYALKIFESSSGKRNLVTCNSMISCYVNCKSPSDALTIFAGMSETDLTTWNLMMRVYAENNSPFDALSLFRRLQSEGMKPDAVTIMSLLPLCNEMASFRLLKECHGYSIRSCFEDVYLDGALLDAYAKCGVVGCAYKLFQSSSQKDLVMFTSMISGYAMHGMGEEALKVFTNMLESGVKPDHVVMTSILSACSHTGLVDQGLDIFQSMEEVNHIKPTMEHYACVVDLLARGGRIADAYSFAIRMPIKPDANIWGTLLGACKTHHEVELGLVVAEQLFETKADDIGNYVVMSNLYAADAKWEGVLEVRKLMKEKEFKKPPGCSWIEVEGEKHFFLAGDSLHPQRNLIYNLLSILHQQIKRAVDIT
ncbi:putative pentatricopeptide repeat-containing protein At5g08490 isoform X1 [Benincasa hispida]|uniref:putative pentatricopeptide repeat-containing protein At5g08490 isoform X1 n=2 Tax=Benincasa hispida TaxID=102211 RepID=UPI0018FF6EF6|nr:putative pentatricopeptide repeat-containing protein At5g08490 isoform X1 [Benincasa hispida]XP_038900365.1 putative pentatricopeptide repeat-containing protein At5g08490 isoform X1 [Benincasa hispida]XP_038900366.1 putative pentatricopeptide repeat-containing protein At5g08490 isoform X1 [Benincasa hispida]